MVWLELADTCDTLCSLFFKIDSLVSDIHNIISKYTLHYVVDIHVDNTESDSCNIQQARLIFVNGLASLLVTDNNSY